MKRLFILTSLAAGALACEDPLVDPATVIAPRIVGARVRAADDPAIAEPRAGEAGSIDWLVISNEAGTLAATAAFCAAEPSALGAPRCSGDAFEQRSVELGFGEPLALDFTLPAELEPGGHWLAWLGSCAGQAARFDAAESGFRCDEGEVALATFYRGRVPEDARNQNPVLADDVLSLGGQPWPPGAGSAQPGAPCAGLELPSVRPGEELEIAFALGGDDREELPVIPDEHAPHARESLVYTHIATAPGLDRAFSAIDFDANVTGFSLPFSVEPASAPSTEGEIINFYLLVRDERGGVDWSRRDVCLVPAAAGGT